jgi:hypothetical protein
MSLLLKAESDPTFSEIIGVISTRTLSPASTLMRFLRIRPAVWAMMSCSFSSFHPEGGVGEQFGDHSRKFEHFFLRHKAPSASSAAD